MNFRNCDGDTGSTNDSALREQGADTAKEFKSKYTATPPSCGKWLTVWRYRNGYFSLQGFDAAFAAHPEWVGA